jgi:predicted DCC family thiol-disulfide oxidoreductase YuxK
MNVVAPGNAALGGKPILLYNDECAVCRHIAIWVRKAAPNRAGETRLIERPIGDDPEALHLLQSDLDIWDAYDTIHLLMPDGSMRLGGEAVAEVLRRLPSTQWLGGLFSLRMFGVRPFQAVLNLLYLVLADLRPLFGCESCGTPSPWIRPFLWVTGRIGALFGKRPASRTSVR